MSVDEQLRRALQSLEETPAADDQALERVLAAGRRLRRRRHRAFSAALVAVVLFAAAAGIFMNRLSGDDRTSVVAGPGPLQGEGWRSLPPAPIEGRHSHSMVWTGEEVIVWGGASGDAVFDDGAAYDPNTDTWRVLSEAPLEARDNHAAIWTGVEMVVVGGSDGEGNFFSDAAAYDPGTDTWRRIPDLPVTPRGLGTEAWTGNEVLVIGGLQASGQAAADGAAYNPATDTWRTLPPVPIEPPARAQNVWTGTEVILFEQHPPGPEHPLGQSRVAAYNPTTDQWRLLPPAPFGSRMVDGPDARGMITPVPALAWTGTELVALTPNRDNPDQPQGAIYDPPGDQWHTIETAPPEPVAVERGIWTGTEVLLWNGNGLAFDPETRQWRRLPDTDHPRRELLSAVWTGQLAVFWGGWGTSSGSAGLSDGAAYQPPVP